jgi:hypothetical protein
MKLVQVAEQNKKYYTKEFIHGFNTGAKTQYEADKKEAERQGRWIEEYSANHFQAKCSACGESTLYGITYDLEGNAYYMNYCPNCGARMDEVEE